ncbi:DUF3846 domain-containing protein [Actinomycetospora termitidis]|uniref:DUF3846 domain-containing protein n=1 Tax=Actinomycetospora termitidis TaxID=3053470 RepID=A0ABT7MIP6_9PSEU|nr:DUF3846 domain-containing protein [Actinomycetospora sp. Odt1-22]MDL5160501.1 DUF3846 domain-containing protein [Actinomycetospora sp. Odt1-22]
MVHPLIARPDYLTALWLPAEGGVTTVRLSLDADQRGDELAALVGGLLDVVRLDEHTDMWINDLGVWGWREPNVMATRVAGAHGMDLQPYHGPVVLTGGADARGDTVGLDDTTATMLASVAFYGATEGPIRPDEIDGHRFYEFDARRYRHGA